MNAKRLPPINFTKRRSHGIIKPLTGPSEGLGVLGPNWEQVADETWGEFNSNSNIFDIEAENDKHESPYTEEYHLTLWKTEGFRIGFED